VLQRNGLSLGDLPTRAATPAALRERLSLLLLDVLLIFVNSKLLELIGKRVGFIRQGIDAAKNDWVIVETVSKVVGTPVIIDSSKRAEQLKLLYLRKSNHFKTIFLIRDGRGVTYSRMQRADISARDAALRWVQYNIKSMLLQVSIPKEKKITVRYEDLCQNPDRELGRICDFVGLPFDERMLTLVKSDKHNISGSPHRFDHTEDRIRLDERWKYSLAPKDLAEFDRIAGILNRLLGYAPEV
jgi:hypothetical protein